MKYNILPDHKIIEWAEGGGIQPFHKSLVNPASVDLRLHNVWRDLHDPHFNNKSNDTMTVYEKSPFVDLWNFFAKHLPVPRLPTTVVASTFETVKLPIWMAAEVKMKTTPTREGLGQVVADWVDPGFQGQLTLMFHAQKTITLEVAERICQLVLYRIDPIPSKSYAVKGHYMGQRGPTLSWRERWKVK